MLNKFFGCFQKFISQKADFGKFLRIKMFSNNFFVFLKIVKLGNYCNYFIVKTVNPLIVFSYYY